MPYSRKTLGQLACPSGAEGRRILHHLNAVNGNINRLTLENLAVVADDRILEIGFGGGALIADILRHAPDAHVTGVEVSALAVDLANQRFRGEIDAGSASFREINEDMLPFDDAVFDKIAAVNVIYFVPDLDCGFREALRVLKPGGCHVLSYAEGSPDRITRFPRPEIEDRLRRVGFAGIVSVSSSDEENGEFHCTVARKPR
jgi:arsenite methyltransferase